MGERAPRDTATNVFVGRQAELTQLRDGLDRLFEGSGAMFLLSGEPGIGKTRLAEQLAIEARLRQARVFWGRCTQTEGAPPYWAWVQILRSLLRDLGETEFGRLAGPRLAQILQVVPELRGHFNDVDPISLDDEQARFRIYDSVTQLVVDAGSKAPIVLVLDDLHWADTPSLLVLQLLAGVLPQSAVMVLGTYRDRELAVSHPLRTHLADFVRRGETTQMSVGGLEESDVVGLVRGLTGFQPVRDLVRRLQSRTGGNPFFLRELARNLGHYGEEQSQRDSAPFADAVPGGVAAVLSRRIETLSDDCRSALEVAALTGLDIDLDLLEAVTHTPRPRLLDLLDEADAKAIVTRRDGSYAFNHGLVRDTVYGGMTRARRSELHGVVGRVIEERSLGEPDIAAAQLAYHFVAAAAVDPSLRAKALQYAAASATRAQAELAYEEAVRLFELSLDMVAPLDRAGRAELLLSLGRARYLSGDIGGAMTAAHEVARLAEHLDERNLLARAALVVRGVGGPGLSEEIRRLCETALARPPDNPSLKIQLLAQQTVVLMQMGDMEHERRAIESSQQALELAQEAVDPDVVFAALHARQMALSGPAGVEERLQLAGRVRDLARETGRPSMAQWGHAWRVDALVQLCRIDEAEVELRLQARLADQLREPLLEWRTRVAQSMLAALRGKFEEAQRLSDEARLLGRKGHHPPAEF
ncbi:MAG: AAA family ATPase, partial [Candidatus Dormibacteraeota bacterium]|nr:AAA family ATPase [Candidatus Dormibacteraeota bacterium]